MRCPTPRELVCLADRGLYPEQERSVREHLSSCRTCQGSAADWQAVIAEVARDSAEFDSPERRAAVFAAALARAETPTRSPRFWSTRFVWSWCGALAVGAMLVLLLVHAPRSEPDSRGFLERGVATADRQWVGLKLFRIVAEGKSPERITSTFRQDDRLLFSYTNLAPAGFLYLTITARDAAGQILWYQPPRPPDPVDQASLTILPGVAGQPIPETVRLPAAVGEITFYAIFSLRPMLRGEVEELIVSPENGPPVDTVVDSVSMVVEAEAGRADR